MRGRIPAIVDGGPSSVGVESTVISLVNETPVLLRPGGISPEQLSEVVGRVVVDQAVTGALAPGRSPGAPGMKYAHYAPRTPITLLSGPIDAQREWVRAASIVGSVGVLCFDDDVAAFVGIPTIIYGPRYDAAAQARRLFAALHEVDELNVDHVYAQFPTESAGVFLAVRNRLLKAAGHRLIEL